MKPVEFKCPKCGLCQDDQDYVCKINGDEIDIYGDPVDAEIIDKLIHRHLSWCSELGFDVDLVVDTDPNHSVDFLMAAVKCYCNMQYSTLEPDKVQHVVLKIRGKFQDCIAYDGYYIGHWFSQCVKELDKAKEGKPFGRDLDEWR